VDGIPLAEGRPMVSERYLVSACLLGVRCRYDGDTNLREPLLALAREGRAIPVCPEQLGGLPTPRVPSEIEGGDARAVWEGQAIVRNAAGEIVTDSFVRGAEEVLRLAQMYGIRAAILKERSPSCGVREVYDGTFQRRRVPGMGIAAYHLLRNGVNVLSDEEFLI